VGIPIDNIKEKCCDSDLSRFTIIEMDALDDVGSTCDKVIECNDKYYLVEEKSILLSFFANCCKEQGFSLDDDYKYIENEIKYLNIDGLFELTQSMDREIKRRILSDTMVNLINTSAKKASNTTTILNKQFDATKTDDMSIFYLYCNSGHEVDMLLTSLLSLYKRTLFIECQKLKSKLEENCQ
jgi:hypothetical protein